MARREMVPRIFGPYEPIPGLPGGGVHRRGARLRVTQSVYVQANWPLDRSIDEVRWVQEVHEATGWPSAVIGSADLFTDARRTRCASGPPLPARRVGRGCNCTGTSARYRFATGPAACGSPSSGEHRRGAGARVGLRAAGLPRPDGRRDRRLVSAFPHDVRPRPRRMLVDTEEEHRPAWEAGLRLAQLADVVVKLTGQGTFVHRWTGADRPGGRARPGSLRTAAGDVRDELPDREALDADGRARRRLADGAVRRCRPRSSHGASRRPHARGLHFPGGSTSADGITDRRILRS